MTYSNNIIKLSNHFTLYIAIKDKIVFESELYNADVKFYLEQDYNLRYHFYVNDGQKVDEIIKEIGIVASNDIISMSDHEVDKKAMKMYLIACITIAIMILSIVIAEDTITQ